MKRISKATFVVVGHLVLTSTCSSFRTGLNLSNFHGHRARVASISRESRSCIAQTPNQQQGNVFSRGRSAVEKSRRLSMTTQDRPEILSTNEITEGSKNPRTTKAMAAATTLLTSFDRSQAAFAKEEGIGMGGGVSASMYAFTLPDEELIQIREAVLLFAAEANRQRSVDQTNGRVMLGICAEDCGEGLASLGSWVTALQLPRGLLHGMDKDGVPLDPATLGSVYIKFNSGGVMRFSEMRKSGLGFDAIWKPGDAILETYDGDFRGVYFSVELDDGEFRQFGVLPLSLFSEEI